MKRRHLISLGLCSALLSACSDKPADATATGFNGIDITGADYATGFSLTDHNGQPRTLADFKGKVVVIFFGYTQCPDVCPTSMSEMAQAKQLLGSREIESLCLYLSKQKRSLDDYWEYYDQQKLLIGIQ